MNALWDVILGSNPITFPLGTDSASHSSKDGTPTLPIYECYESSQMSGTWL